MPQPQGTPQAEAPPSAASPGAAPAAPNLLEDLTGDRLPASGETPPGGEKPPTSEPMPPADKPPVTAEGEPPAAPGKPPEPKRYKVGDREYTVEELQQSGRLDDLLITYGKHQTLTQKHEEVRSQLDAFQRQALEAAKPKPPTDQPPAVTPDRVQASYAPILANDVKGGWLEPDFVELYPRTAAVSRYHIDRLDGLMQAVSGLAQEFREIQGRVLGTRPDDVFGRLDKDLQTIGADAKASEFGVLKDPKVREGFVEFLKGLDPKVKQIQDPEFLRRQFYAYNNEAIAEAARQLKTTEPADDAQRRKQAAGEGRPGGRPPATPSPQPSHLETLIEGALPPARR